jgi:hypothetical protein
MVPLRKKQTHNNLMMRNIKPITAFLVALLAGAAHAQEFNWQATLSGIDSTGFYRAALSPDMVANMNSSFSDVRLYDTNRNEVPYLYQEEQATAWKQLFRPYEIVENKSIPRCCTRLTLRNNYHTRINNISLTIRNAAVVKSASLMGSDDQKNWYVVKDRFLIENIASNESTSEVKFLDFPLSQYTYYQLNINDSTTGPVQILNAGFYDFFKENGKFTELPGGAVTSEENKNDKTTRYTWRLNNRYRIDKVEFTFTGAPFYNRKAALYAKQTHKNKKGKPETTFELIQHIEINSTLPSSFALNDINTDEILLIVYNEDNPALQLSSAKAWQLNRYLVMWLEKEKTYTLKLGNASLRAPSYDLGYFTEKIPAQPPLVSITDLKVIEKTLTDDSTFFTDKRMIWIALTVVIALLGFMTLRLVKDMGKNNSDTK